MHDFLSQSEEKIDVLFTIATTIWEITEISNWENGVGSGWIFQNGIGNRLLCFMSKIRKV